MVVPSEFVISRVIINPVTSSCFFVYNCKGTKCKEHKYFCSGVNLTKIKNLPYTIAVLIFFKLIPLFVIFFVFSYFFPSSFYLFLEHFLLLLAISLIFEVALVFTFFVPPFSFFV